MNPECFEQLTDGYEEAINSVSDLTDTLSELQETLIDFLSTMHGDIQALTVSAPRKGAVFNGWKSHLVRCQPHHQ